VDQSSQAKPNLTHDPIVDVLKKMTIPMVFGLILLLTFGLVDTFFVSLLGTDELAAISFTFPVTFTVISLNIGLGIGTSAIVAKLMGAGDASKAEEYATGALMISVILVGVLALIGFFTIEPIFRLLGAADQHMSHIKDYMQTWYLAGVFLALPMVGNSVLRASGDTATPSKIMALGGFINAALDPLLIFGWGPVPALGIQGAALATMIAWLIGTFYILFLLYRRDLMLPRLLNLAELIESSRKVLKIGLSAAGANMLTPIAGGVMTAIVAVYGSEAVAAWGVGNRIEAISSIIVLALSMSLPPVISQNFGSHNIARVQQAYMLSIRFVLLWQLGIFLLVWLASPYVAAIFSDDPKVLTIIMLFLSIVPLGYGLQGIVILSNSSLNALHKPMAALALSIVRLFVFFVPLSWLGSYLFGLSGMFWAGVLANFFTAGVAYLGVKRVLAEQLQQQVNSAQEAS
jgi:putative MATE family efflux protein